MVTVGNGHKTTQRHLNSLSEFELKNITFEVKMFHKWSDWFHVSWFIDLQTSSTSMKSVIRHISQIKETCLSLTDDV